MKLAMLRGISHRELLESTSSREISEYMALNLIDPLFIGDRVDAGFATLANLTYNLGRDPDANPTSIVDWLPDYEARLKTPEEREAADIARAFDKWAVQVNQSRHA